MHPLHNIWQGIIQRCTNPNNPNYKRYGAKGISVCDRWMNFDNFVEDVGIRPKNYCLDRIDDKGNYEPLNCRWLSYRDNHPLIKNNKVKRENLVGQRFGKYLVVDVIIPKTKLKRFLCECDCGIRRVVDYARLKSGIITSCYACKRESRIDESKSTEQ